MELTEKENEVLSEAEYILRKPHNGVQWVGGYVGWFTPLCVGGGSGSHHFYTLKKLIKKGLIETLKRDSFSGIRGSRIYRITDSGVKLIEEIKAEKAEQKKNKSSAG